MAWKGAGWVLPWLAAVVAPVLFYGCGGGTKNTNPVQVAPVTVSGTISGSVIAREASAQAALRVLAVSLSGDYSLTNVASSGKFSMSLARGAWQLTVLDRKTPPTQAPIYYSAAKELTPVLPLDLSLAAGSLDLGVITLSGGKLVVSKDSNPLAKIRTSSGDSPATSLTASNEITGRAATLGTKLTEAVAKLAAANNAPALTGSFSASVTLGQKFTYTISASDADGDTLTYLTEGTLPAGLSISANVISGSPTVTGSLTIVIGASDGIATVTASLSLEVFAPGANPAEPLPNIHGTWLYSEDVLSSSADACGKVDVRTEDMEGRFHVTQTADNYVLDRWTYRVNGFPNTFPLTGHGGKVTPAGQVTFAAASTAEAATNCSQSVTLSGSGQLNKAVTELTLQIEQTMTFTGSGCAQAGKPAVCSSGRTRLMTKISDVREASSAP